IIASLIETCKLNAITKIVNGYPNKQIDELLPWAYPASPTIRRVA
ncbi:MAG: transposase domain-containing protein, partial [Alphaproteobacteria bacterium]|nr:transposase domain-containing protein [Alphaproteobacteria bacterium]